MNKNLTDFSSDISGFYKLSLEERQRQLVKLLDLNQDEIELLEMLGYFSPSQIDRFIENVVGSYQLPIGLAFNFKINISFQYDGVNNLIHITLPNNNSILQSYDLANRLISVEDAFSHSLVATMEIIFVLSGILSVCILVINYFYSKKTSKLEI